MAPVAGRWVVAVAFAPLRDGLQRAVNRLTYGRWNQPYEVLPHSANGSRLRQTSTCCCVTSWPSSRVSVSRDVTIVTNDGEVVAGGPAVADSMTVPLAAYGQPVGSLLVRHA